MKGRFLFLESVQVLNGLGRRVRSGTSATGTEFVFVLFMSDRRRDRPPSVLCCEIAGEFGELSSGVLHVVNAEGHRVVVGHDGVPRLIIEECEEFGRVLGRPRDDDAVEGVRSRFDETPSLAFLEVDDSTPGVTSFIRAGGSEAREPVGLGVVARRDGFHHAVVVPVVDRQARRIVRLVGQVARTRGSAAGDREHRQAGSEKEVEVVVPELHDAPPFVCVGRNCPDAYRDSRGEVFLAFCHNTRRKRRFSSHVK